MKALFKLKNKPITGFKYELPSETAEQIYANRGVLGDLYCPVRVSWGFYSKALTFEEWLSFYCIRIL